MKSTCPEPKPLVGPSWTPAFTKHLTKCKAYQAVVEYLIRESEIDSVSGGMGTERIGNQARSFQPIDRLRLHNTLPA